MAGSSACPMAAAGGAASPAMASGCPFAAATAAGAAGSSAVPQGMVASPSGEALDPRNMMPVLPQTAAPGQSCPLSKQRETSSIPRADDVSNWVYPSPQQFYNALLRKNKDPEADAMDAVVHTHNVTNERTWQRILDWERLHERSCATPKLVRFVGRSQDLSFGALCSRTLSYRGVPFDRHDWFVDRCGQKVVRYVIDYYDDPFARDEDGMDITIEARPALDTLGAATDRLRRPAWQVRRVWAALFGGGGTAV
uniref:Holocytochrome c-type synthase n=1 Tax=Pyrodinium bahamense TaxID=73915 RepID=A0A7R9ZZX8_9DINO